MKRLVLSTILILGCIYSLAACSSAPSESAIQTAIAQTNAVNPSSTITLEPTLTLTLTPTSTNTSTSTMTATPTKTNTPTPLPPVTQTAQAISIGKTQASIDKTSTASALSIQRTKTADAKSARATQIASYTAVPWRDFITYPDKFTGNKIKINGQVFNVVGDSAVQMYVGNYEAIYVEMDKSFSDIYENSWIIVYGTGNGKKCFDNAYGAEICQPLLKKAFYVFP